MAGIESQSFVQPNGGGAAARHPNHNWLASLNDQTDADTKDSGGKHGPDSWLSHASADCYEEVKAASESTTVRAVVATALIGAAIPVARAAFIKLAGRAVSDAATGVMDETSSALSGVVAKDANGTKFVFNERPIAQGSLGSAEVHSTEASAVSAGKEYSKTWIGKDGAQYGFKNADVQDPSWHQIYESEFPADERQPYDFLNSLAGEGAVPRVTLQLTERNGKTAAFSMLSDYGEGSEGRRLLLPYIAVERDLQGMGIGSTHLSEMVQNTRAAFPTAKGMVIEVEDPQVPGLAAEDLAKRMQRIDFYVNRHGATLLDNKYLIPSAEEGAAPLPAKMLWLDFGRGGATDRSMHSLISSIYKHGYELAEDDPVVKQVLGKYSN